MSHSFLEFYKKSFVIASLLAVMATLLLEHSAIDVAINQWFYLGDGKWIIDKNHAVFDLFFYSGIKKLLIGLAVYLLVAWIWRSRYFKKYPLPIFLPVQLLSGRELGYLIITMLLVPTVVATLKLVTQTPCPVNLQLFGGELPYLPMWENIQMNMGKKCFPAAHASSGFALYAFAFLPSVLKKSRRQYWMFVLMVSCLGFVMGGYKMLIGDHFFSHTLVSLLLAWAICAGMASVFFKNKSH